MRILFEIGLVVINDKLMVMFAVEVSCKATSHLRAVNMKVVTCTVSIII